jgi:hypothetical protein
MAASASMSGASRRKRCCTPRRRSRRRPKHFPALGITVGELTLDLKKMMAFKDEGVQGNVKGVEFLLKKNKIDTFQGTARIAAVGQVEVRGEDGANQVLETKNIVIATGLGRDKSCRVSRSTKRWSCPRPARSNWKRCRKSSWSSAPG